MKRMKKLHMAIAVSALCIVCAGLPLSLWANDAVEPELGSATNVTAEAVISNGGENVTEEYHENGCIRIASEERGSIGELLFGKSNSYTYSAEITFTSDSSSYGSIRFVLAQGINNAGVNKTIEVCVRPNLKDAVIFSNGWGEEAIAHIGGLNLNFGIGGTCRYTVRYDNGKVSFWLDGERIFDRVDITTGLNDIVLTTGFYSQNCVGYFSNIKIWGDVAPATDRNVENIADDIRIVNNGMDITEKYLSGKKIEVSENGRGSFSNLEFGDSKRYLLTADVLYTDDSSSFGSIRFVLAKGIVREKDEDGVEQPVEKTVEVCIRPNLDQAILGMVGGSKGEEWPCVNFSTFDFQKSYRHTVLYDNGKVTFWVNGILIFESKDMSAYIENLEPSLAFYSQNCTGTISNLSISGDVKAIVEPQPGSEDGNLFGEGIVTNPSTGKTEVLGNLMLETPKNYTDSSKASVGGLLYGKSYNFSTVAAFYDNPSQNGDAEVNWEGLVFQIATAEKDGTVYDVEVRFRNGLAGVFVGNEPYGLDYARGTAYGSENKYTISFHEDGTFTVFQNGAAVYNRYDITKLGYTNVKPSFAFGGEACAYQYKALKLWGDVSLKEIPKVPQMPAGNGNYADYMRVPTNSLIRYENGRIYSTSDANTGRTEFGYLPFSVKDTYVYGVDVKTKKAQEIWMGPRLLFGVAEDGRELQLYIMKESIGVFCGEEEVKSVSFHREDGKNYRLDMLVEPQAVSVWVDGTLLIDHQELPKKSEVITGILFENAIAEISDMTCYYTDKVKFVIPDIPKEPEKPVLKPMDKNQYNAADWMKVTLDSETYTGYFGNKLSQTDSSLGSKYFFENIPVTDEMSYYYRATYTVTESTEIWKGPRFIFRQDDGNCFYVAILQNSVILLAETEEVASAPMTLELGRSYDIAIYSTPNMVTVWIDGELVFENLDLTEYIHRKLEAKPGILFELCQARLENIAIYGDGIVFDEKYVDSELYYDTYYKMSEIPSVSGNNLFCNILLKYFNGDSIGLKFDAQKNILTTEYPQGGGSTAFTDALGSFNLNGLKNTDGWVLSFKYRVDEWSAENIGGSGFWIQTNSSAAPWTTENNTISVGFSGDALMLQVQQEGRIISQQLMGMRRMDGKEYDVSIVRGKSWMKVYVDKELKMVSTALPEYNLSFAISYSNVKSEISQITLYALEDNGLVPADKVEEQEGQVAGNTIYDAKEVEIEPALLLPIVAIVVSVAVMLLALTGIVVFVIREKKRMKVKVGMEGDTVCEKES